jgi:hypothetical protein
MRLHLSPSIVRLSGRPVADEPGAVVGPRRRGSRRPHTDAKVAAVRRLVEQSELTYAEIAARTGVAPASICRWTRDGGWQRPLFAPRATDTIPRARASAHLRMRTLAARLAALAERYVRELEDTPGVDLDKLAEALELMKLAKLAARPKRRHGAGAAQAQAIAETFAAGPRAVMRGLRAAGVAVERAPEEALEDFIESRAPPPERPRRQTRRRIARDDYHAWLLGKDES